MEPKLGLIQSKQINSDWIAGEYTPLAGGVIRSSGIWVTPEVEYQNRWSYDRLACVSYSLLNCLESLYYIQTGKWINFSDRFLAKMSNTTHSGNSLDVVFDTVRKQGLVLENDYQDTDGGWNEYYKEIPQSIKDKGKEFLNEWSFYREWVRTDDREKIFNSLYEVPLQVTVAFANGNGILNPKEPHNHAVMLYGAKYKEYWMIFDHYTQSYKKYAWDYEFGACLKPTLIKRTNTIINLKNNTLVFLMQGEGEFGLYLDGKIIVDELPKVLATFQMRNNGDTKGMTKTLTLEEWNKYDKHTLEEFAKLEKKTV